MFLFLPACMRVYYGHALCLQRPEEGVSSSGTSYRQLPLVMWVLGTELGQLPEPPVLLTDEPSL